MDTLRDILLGNERADLQDIEDRLIQLEERLSDKFQRVEDVSEVIAEAIQLRQAQDGAMGNGLQESVELALERSLSDKPNKFAKLLSPIFWQTFRQSSRISFQQEQQDKFELEQVFLIHKDSEYLLLHDAVKPDTSVTSEESTFDLLLNIREFMREVHETTRFDAANILRVGQLSIWIEWGPLAVVAAVIRGQPPENFRQQLLMLVEHLHEHHDDKLRNFDGDTTNFDALNAIFRHYLGQRNDWNAVLKTFIPFFILGLAALALIIWASLGSLEKRQWQGYLENLEAQPGLVITQQYKNASGFHLSGLQDPLAVSPQDLLANTKLRPSRVNMNWQAYYALEPNLILKRAAERLAPPEGVSLVLENNKLILPADAPADWLNQAKTLAFFIPGVEGVSLR